MIDLRQPVFVIILPRVVIIIHAMSHCKCQCPNPLSADI
jgi:hypothetical protein